MLKRYMQWLHTRWPAGTVERLPEVREDGRTTVPGVYVAGDLAGVPLLKFSLDTGAKAVERIAADPALRGAAAPENAVDLTIIGAGVSGMAAAVEAKRRGLSFVVLEASEAFSTLVNFPRRKPIFTYPRDMTPAGTLQVRAEVKEDLIAELREQVERAGIAITPARAERIERRDGLLHVHVADAAPVVARRVLVAIGRSGDFRRLGVPGEDLDKVYNRLHDPNDFRGRRCLVVGGGDSALETAIALAGAGAHVTLSYRGDSFARPKPEHLHTIRELSAGPAGAAAGPALEVRMATRVTAIRPDEVDLAGSDGARTTLPNDVVFTMIGREAPLAFFRRSGISIAGEMTPARWIALGLFVLFCTWMYDLKSGGATSQWWYAHHWFPTNLPDLLARAGAAIAARAKDPATLVGTLAISASGPAFWYTLAYSLVVVVFGVLRIRRRRTPYITAQTLTLMAVQVVPLFLLPEVILPLLEHHGLIPAVLDDALFPAVTYGHGREFWRAYGLVLAWPLNVYNVFTHEPLWAWIGIGIAQTLILIPLGIWFFGKGVYCGWICSCGALAETLGDAHRHKMPHGPGWNRLNMAGQVILAIAVVMLLLRIAGWVLPEGNWAAAIFEPLMKGYERVVDVTLAGVVGVGAYFWYSGRVWCRFFCPLAALMHVYTRFSRFRILADKKKCISCNQCTTVCHQGIDVMNFANKGLSMADPECVRCSACVHACPTGVLRFGQVDRAGQIVSIDSLMASPVQMREGR